MNEELKGLIQRWPLVKHISLPPDSIILVVGSYTGLGMELLNEMFSPSRIIGFDPQRWALDEATIRLQARNYHNFTLFNFGLGFENATYPMGEWHTDACSFINVGEGSRQQGTGSIRDANEVLRILKLPLIDLMVMNIEGFEFTLLPYLKATGWIDKIDRLAVQWHLGLGDEPKSYDDIADCIDRLEEYGMRLEYDERPAWTLSVR